MTAKEYLMQIRKLNSDIQNIDDEIKKLREETASLRSAWPDGQLHGTGTTDPTGRVAVQLADELADAERRHVQCRRKLWRKRLEVIEAIRKVERADCSRLLYLRYVQCERWEQIAVEMDFTYQWVAGGLHSIALKEFEKILAC